MKQKIWQKRFLELKPKLQELKNSYETLFQQFESYKKEAKAEIAAYRAENELFRKRLNENHLPTHTDELAAQESKKSDIPPSQIIEENKT